MVRVRDIVRLCPMHPASFQTAHPSRRMTWFAATALLSLCAQSDVRAESIDAVASARGGTGNAQTPSNAIDVRADPTVEAIRTAPPDASSRIVAEVDDRVLANDRAMHAARQRIQNVDAGTAARFREVSSTVREAERRLHRSLQAAEATPSPADWTQRRQELAEDFAAYLRAFRTAQQIAGMDAGATSAKAASE